MFKRGLSLVACALALAVALETEAQRKLTAPIINGVNVPGGAASVGLVIGELLCTGTLVGCRTVLTAAHCVCPPGSGSCAAPGFVFFQHLGPVAVQEATVHPGYVPGSPAIHDLAVLRLAAPAANLPTALINTTGRVPYGSTVGLLGFGRAAGGPQEGDFTGGILRAGQAVTAPCNSADAFNLCTNFLTPIGPAGEDSSTCQGDSGGPIVANGVVAGVVSGGAATCLPPSQPWNADAFLDRAWIAQAAAGDLGSQCPAPRVGEVGATWAVAEDFISTSQLAEFDIEVPPGTTQLRVTLMSEGSADADLAVSRSGAVECTSEFSGLPDVCVLDDPTPGTRRLSVFGFDGAGTYQLVATTITPPATTSCTPGPSTLCIDSSPGDRRFRAEVTYSTVQGGGASGQASAVPLAAVGASAGGLFTFFSPSNPELMLKILNACVPPFNRYWIFYAATTNVGFTVRVTDTVTGNTWTRTNPDQTPALPVQDTDALPCS